MSSSRADEKTKRSWGSGTHGSGSGTRYVKGPSVAPVHDRGEEETHTGAGIKQGGHEPDIIFVVKRDSMILRVSHPVYGAPGGGVVGHSILVFFAQEHSADITRSFETVFASGEPQSFVVRANPPLPNGAWYHCRVSPNHSESGVESATLFARDITEWKHTQDEFEELSRFRAIMNRAGEAIFVTDASTGRFVDVNETACRWLGFSREKLLQMCAGDLNLEFPLEGIDGVTHHIADTRDGNRPKAFVRGSHRRRDGTSFPVEVTLSQQRFGDHDFLLVVAREVKQRRSAEQTFLDGENERRRLFAMSRDAYYCSARDGTVSEVNDSALDLFGYTRGEFLGLDARKLYRYPEHIRAFQRAVEEDGSVQNFRVEFQAKSGQSFQGYLGATERYDSDGKVQGYHCFISPVGETAFREAERVKREIEEARSEAAAARADVERAKKEIEKARLDAEHGMTELAIAKIDAGAAKQRAGALEREVEQARQEIERARSETEKAECEAANARAKLEKAEQELVAKTSAPGAVESEPRVIRTGRGTRIHVEGLPNGVSLWTKGGGTLLVDEAAVRPRRTKEPTRRPGRRKGSAVWLAVAVIAVAASAAGLLSLSSDDDLTGSRAATASDSLQSGIGQDRSPEDSITLVAPGSEGVADSPVEFTADSTTA